jgi:hypothetical protein
MKTPHVILLTAGAAIIAASGPLLSQTRAPVPGGGMLRTLPHGDYECALPGDAAGDAYVVVEDEGFRISTASRYSSMLGDGTYILRGTALTFTRGPKNGDRYERVGENQLRKLDANGQRSALLCTRLSDRRD